MHVHLDTDPTYGGYTGLQFNDRFWSVLTVPHARSTLQAGFTTVRNVGSDAWNDVGLRQAIDEGKIPGPRIVSAAYSFGATGGHCDSHLLPAVDGAEESRSTPTAPRKAAQRVRELRKYGAQVIKICATGGVFSRNTEPGQQQLTLEEMKAIVEEAHMQGLKVAAHAHGASGIQRRDPRRRRHHRARQPDRRRGHRAGEEARRVAVDGHLQHRLHPGRGQEERRARGQPAQGPRDRRDCSARTSSAAHAAGVKMVYGTDAGVYPHGDNAQQFAVMVRYGMTPLRGDPVGDAERRRGARRARTDRRGRGRPLGRPVAVTGDPLDDVRLLESVAFVMKGGTVVKEGK